MIGVYHKNGHGKRFFELMEDEPYNPEDFNLIAKVDTDDLEEAYMLTNHIDHDWTGNKKIKMFTPDSFKGNRSTSVGDVMILNRTQMFEVATAGFNDITVKWNKLKERFIK